MFVVWRESFALETSMWPAHLWETQGAGTSSVAKLDEICCCNTGCVSRDAQCRWCAARRGAQNWCKREATKKKKSKCFERYSDFACPEQWVLLVRLAPNCWSVSSSPPLRTQRKKRPTSDPHQVNWKAYVNPVNRSWVRRMDWRFGLQKLLVVSNSATRGLEALLKSWQCMHQRSTNQRSSSQFCRCMSLLLLLSPQSQSS